MASDFRARLGACFRARVPGIWVRTREEARLTRVAIDVASGIQLPTGIPGESRPCPVMVWDCARGLVDARTGEVLDGGARDLSAWASTLPGLGPGVYILADVSPWLGDQVALRALRLALEAFRALPASAAKIAVCVVAQGERPAELADALTSAAFDLPELPDLRRLYAETCRRNQLDAATAEDEAPPRAALGLTESEARVCFALSLVRSSRRGIDAADVFADKRGLIEADGSLRWIEPHPAGLGAVGGLDGLKLWLSRREAGFSAAAAAAGIPAPRGVLLVGVPGCGKSLCAKAVGAAWRVPTVRLDMGALKSKYVGDSEANIRRALALAERIAPAVLWLDEIEKALGGRDGVSDGGVSADALGTVLTWMQDRAAPVFVVATANAVDALPPELLRKGRFDDIFFVDLPSLTERAAIAETVLRSVPSHEVSADMVAASSSGYSGAEIEAAIREAQFGAFAAGRVLTTADVAAEIRATVPLSKTSSTRIDELRAWARGRCRLASVAADQASAAGISGEIL